MLACAQVTNDEGFSALGALIGDIDIDTGSTTSSAGATCSPVAAVMPMHWERYDRSVRFFFFMAAAMLVGVVLGIIFAACVCVSIRQTSATLRV